MFFYSFIDSSVSGKNPSVSQPPVVLTQHLDPPFRRFLLISAHGIVHFRLPSPLTKLRDYMLNSLPAELSSRSNLGDLNQSSLIGFGLSNDGDGSKFLFVNEFLSSYLHQFGPDEAITSALVVGASSNSCGIQDRSLFSVEQVSNLSYYF